MKKFRFVIPFVSAVLAVSFYPGLSGAQNTELRVGDRAPEFQAATDEGDIWNSSDHVGKKTLVVFFYPAAMTGGCTLQACNFRDQRPLLDEAGAQVIGISGDPVENLKLFRRAHNLNFPLLSDADGRIAAAFGVPTRGGQSITREIDGQEYVLSREITAARWPFIIDTEGKNAYIDREVNAAEDSKRVMDAIRRINRSAGENRPAP